MEIKIFGIFRTELEVKKAVPEIGHVSMMTDIKTYPVLTDRHDPQRIGSVARITFAPDEGLRRKWNMLVGLDEAKEIILRHFTLCIDLRLTEKWIETFYPNMKNFEGYFWFELGVQGKVLVEGDSGTGKTTFCMGIADALARALGKEVVLVEVGLLRDKLVGESTRRVFELFQKVRTLVSERIVLLLLDEFDTVATNRALEEQNDEVRAATNALLEELGKVSPADNILVIAATNFVYHVDPGMDRRFDWILTFDRPDLKQRQLLFSKLLDRFSINPSSILRLAKKTEGYTNADIKKIAVIALEQSIFEMEPLTEKYLLRAIEEVKPTRSCDSDGRRK